MPSNSAKNLQDKPHHVVLVVFPETKLLDVTGPLQVFQDARTTDGDPAYKITLASVDGGPVATDTCITLDTVSFNSLAKAPVDTVLVSGGAIALKIADDKALQKGLGPLLNSAGRVGSVCTGAFILAAGGHLSGRKATTHWMHCEELRHKAGKINVDADAIFVVDDHVWTSAGVSSGIDMALAMVEADFGRGEALRLARVLVLYLKRPGGQTQFSAPLRRQVSLTNGDLDELLAWIDDNLTLKLSVDQLAERVCMSNRNFARVFTKEIGLTPAAFVEQRRVEAASKLLETANLSLKKVCSQVGFRSQETLRRAFLKIKGVPPMAYADRFGEAD